MVQAQSNECGDARSPFSPLTRQILSRRGWRPSATALLFNLMVLVWAQGAPSSAVAAVPSALVDELGAVVEEAAQAESPEARAWSMRAKALLGTREVRELLLEQAQNTDMLVRVFAVMGLIQMDVREGPHLMAAEIVAAGGASRQRILERYLGHLSESTQVSVLEEALDGIEDPEGLLQVLRWVALRGEGAVYGLLGRATEVEEDTAGVYVRALLSVPRPEAVTIARRLAQCDRPALRLAAVEIAGIVPSDESRNLMESMLGDADPEVAGAAAFTLAPLGSPGAYSRLVELAETAEPSMRARAIEAIRDGNPSLLRYDDLVEMVGNAQDPDFRRRAYEALGATNTDQAFEMLRGMLSQDIYETRLDAIAGLGYTRRVEAVPLLGEVLLGGGGPELRRMAAEALGHLHRSEAARPLLDGLNRERSGEVLPAIVQALATSPSEEAIWPLAFLLSNDDAQVVRQVLDTLGALEARAVSAQIENTATSHRQPDVRWKANLVLLSLDPEVGQIRLMQAIENPPDGFMQDIDRLPEALRLQVLRRLLRQSNSDVRALAASRVLSMRGEGLALLRELLDPSVPTDMRELAVSVLTALAQPEDLPRFLEIAESSSRQMRDLALEAIVQLADPSTEPLLRSLLEVPELERRTMAVYGIWNMNRE